MKVIILGASGLIGSHLLQLVLKDPNTLSVIALLRKPLSVSHPKLEQRILDFTDTTIFENAITAADVIFCCIGTTQKKVKGDKDAYRKIDYDIPVQAAKYAVAAGIQKYILVSAIGANAKSKNFYLQLKGEVEEAIAALPFEFLGIVQPSLLIGHRKEKRRGEKIAQLLMPLFNFLLLGSLARYKSIKAETVAKAMFNLGSAPLKGIQKFTYKEIRVLSDWIVSE